MGLLDAVARALGYRRADEERFVVGPEGTWPPGAVILPGGLGRLRGTHSDPPLPQPWVDGDGVPHLFGGPEGEE